MTVEQILNDVFDVLSLLKSIAGVKNRDLIIYGRSIGTGFALQLTTALENWSKILID